MKKTNQLAQVGDTTIYMGIFQKVLEIKPKVKGTFVTVLENDGEVYTTISNQLYKYVVA